jgi:hypothetical protein
MAAKTKKLPFKNVKAIKLEPSGEPESLDNEIVSVPVHLDQPSAKFIQRVAEMVGVEAETVLSVLVVAEIERRSGDHEYQIVESIVFDKDTAKIVPKKAKSKPKAKKPAKKAAKRRGGK